MDDIKRLEDKPDNMGCPECGMKGHLERQASGGKELLCSMHGWYLVEPIEWVDLDEPIN